MTELPRQFPNHLLGIRVVAGHFLHRLRQFQHRFPRFRHQFIAGLTFLLVDMEQFLTEDLIGQRGLDLPDTILGEVRLIGFR